MVSCGTSSVTHFNSVNSLLVLLCVHFSMCSHVPASQICIFMCFFQAARNKEDNNHCCCCFWNQHTAVCYSLFIKSLLFYLLEAEMLSEPPVYLSEEKEGHPDLPPPFIHYFSTLGRVRHNAVVQAVTFTQNQRRNPIKGFRHCGLSWDTFITVYQLRKNVHVFVGTNLWVKEHF